jgi:hypothetical protein
MHAVRIKGDGLALAKVLTLVLNPARSVHVRTEDAA